MNKKTIISLLSIGIFLLTTGISFAAFSYFYPAVSPAIPVAKPNADGTISFNQDLPRTQPCPINGVLYSKQQEAWWQQHAPLGVMIENSTDARPQSGLSFADTVYEAVAEGGITRFLAVFYCQDAPEVGPVRSARTYYLQWISEYGNYPLYAHVGGANASGPADALGQIDSYGWSGYNDLNQFSIGFPTFWRDYTRLGHDVATEHTMYSTTTKLWTFAKTRAITNVDSNGVAWDTNFVPYSFKDDASLSQRPAEQSIHIDFWGDPSYAVDWTYDRVNNVYKRNNGGQPHMDLDTKKQLAAKNIVVLFMPQTNADDGYMNNEHLLYENIGSGKTEIFMDGKQINGTWKKTSRKARTLLYDSSGAPITFDRGVIWFEAQPLDGVVTVK